MLPFLKTNDCRRSRMLGDALDFAPPASMWIPSKVRLAEPK